MKKRTLSYPTIESQLLLLIEYLSTNTVLGHKSFKSSNCTEPIFFIVSVASVSLQCNCCFGIAENRFLNKKRKNGHLEKYDGGHHIPGDNDSHNVKTNIG